MNNCKTCGQEIPLQNMRVSIHGMYDMHLFCSFDGATIDEVIGSWRKHNATPNPAIVGGRKVNDLGKTSLCPITVLATNEVTGEEIELRRVGKMVMDDSPKYDKDLRAWRDAAFADPDIARILADKASEGNDETTNGDLQE